MPSRSALRSFVAAVAVLAIAACGDDNDTVQDDVTPTEAALAARASVIGLQTGFSNTTTIIANEASKPQPVLAPQHMFDLECPIVDLESSGSQISMVLFYGPDPGCTSELDGHVHTGSLVISANGLTLNPISFEFDNYTTGDFSIDGGLGGTINFVTRSVALEVVDLFVTGPNGNTVVDGNLSGTLNNNNTPLLLRDDSWTVRGNAVVTATDQKVYVVEIVDTAPVLFGTSCAWPLSGRVSVEVALGNSGNTSAPAAQFATRPVVR
jgi:hypothetical protein